MLKDRDGWQSPFSWNYRDLPQELPGWIGNLPFAELAEPSVGFVAYGEIRPQKDIHGVTVYDVKATFRLCIAPPLMLSQYNKTSNLAILENRIWSWFLSVYASNTSSGYYLLIGMSVKCGVAHSDPFSYFSL
jgi:hypothetical protein